MTIKLQGQILKSFNPNKTKEAQMNESLKSKQFPLRQARETP